MSDPLSLLREYNVEQKMIEEDNHHFIFGPFKVPKHTKTNFICYGTDKEGHVKDYYTLESVLFLLKHSEIKHSSYAQQAASNLIPVVGRPDRKELLAFINGEITTCKSIDYAAPIEMLPMTSHIQNEASNDNSSTAPIEPESKEDEEELRRLKDLFASKIGNHGHGSEAKDLLSATDIAPSGSLAETMSLEKIAEIKAKRLCKKRATIRSTEEDKEIDPMFKKLMEKDAAETKDILSREVQFLDRTSILHTTGRGFHNIYGILKAVHAKKAAMKRSLKHSGSTNANTASVLRRSTISGVPMPNSPYNRYDQERFQNKEETPSFIKNPLGSFHKLIEKDPNPLNQQHHSSPQLQRLLKPSPVTKITSSRVSVTPIIIVPSTPTSLISLYNARKIFEDFTFVTSDEMKRTGARRDKDILIHRPRNGAMIPYRITDQPMKLEMAEWARVVAVFVLGPPWQFKNWPWSGNPTEIFVNVCGFHVKYDNTDLDTNVSKWAVNVIEISRNKRHLDRAAIKNFWEKLDQHIAKTNPTLRY